VNSSIEGFAKFDAIYNADALILPLWNEGPPTIILGHDAGYASVDD